MDWCCCLTCLQTCLTIAKDLTTSGEILRSLSTHKALSIQCAVLSNPKTPKDVINMYVTHPNSYMRTKLAYLSTLDFSQICLLAKDSQAEIRMAIAGRENLPFELWELFAKDPDLDVRRRVASNSKCPNAILTSLVADKDSVLQEILRNHPNTPNVLKEFLRAWASKLEIALE